ncbi:MAG: DUF1579 family protein [Planctomycetes bacterium]|nr:DUF1579 family protein [Planctomycetota bacterium]MCB9884266.1 DUF1579 family protein [Planctomycetota bacterium]
MLAKHLAPLLPLVLSISPALCQEMPAPAPELKKLAALAGNWAGQGTATFAPGAPPSAWHASGSYRWVLDGFFLQEDFEIHFDGVPAPMLFRAYLGWDAEGKRYVTAVCNNAGEVGLHEIVIQPDGSMLQLMMQRQDGVPYAERSLLKVDGDTMTHSIDLMTGKGPSMAVVEGKFRRIDTAFEGRFDAPTWNGATPHADITRLCRMAGKYDTKGEMVMAPGQPKTAIHGDDTFRTVFGGTLLFGETVGGADGMPGEYRSHAFWGYDQKKGCARAVFVSNMGEVGEMEGRWVDDKFVSTMAGTMMGQPMVQRFLLEVDGEGAVTRGVGHTIVGTMPPFESFVATYAKK